MEEILPACNILIQKMEEEETPPDLFYDVRITLIPKADKDITRKQIYPSTSMVNIIAKILLY